MLLLWSVVISLWVVVESHSDGCYTAPLTNFTDIDGCAHIDNLAAKLMVEVVHGKEIKCGKHVKIADSRNPPHIHIENFNTSTYYHLLMVDPDAPSRENSSYKYYFHWGMANITKKDVDSNSGNTFLSYAGPQPPKDTGLHRYQFLLFQTMHGVEMPDVEERKKVDIEAFIKDRKLCHYLVATFEYLASYNDYLYQNGVNGKEAGTVFVVTMVLIAKLLPSFA